MKSTERLFDNVERDDFRKCKVDLQHAVETVMKKRITEKKVEILKKINERK